MKADPRANDSPAPEPGWRRAVTTAFAARSLCHRFRSIAAHLRPQAAGLRRAGLAGGRRLHGPGQLGHRSGRRRAVWLRAAVGGADVQLHGDPAAASGLKLGIVAGRDLAQACRDHYSPPVAIVLWVLCEIAIAACDLAEVIGSAVALKLLFGLPLEWGVLLTACDVLVVLLLQNRSFRSIEAVVVVADPADRRLLCLRDCCLARPPVGELAAGLIPTPEIIRNPSMLYLAVGILGATVMPHNLYLHSSIVQTRAFERSDAGKAMAIRFATIDSTAALLFAFFINAAILIVAAAAFHGTAARIVADINDAYELLSPVLNNRWASIVFALALLASGQNSTLTGTMAGQIVMEGFLHLRLRPWVRRLLTRLVAIVPAVIVARWYGEHGVGKLLVLEPGDFVVAIEFCRGAVGLVHQRPAEDGPIRQSALAGACWRGLSPC